MNFIVRNKTAAQMDRHFNVPGWIGSGFVFGCMGARRCEA
jgi:hypothetical protein